MLGSAEKSEGLNTRSSDDKTPLLKFTVERFNTNLPYAVSSSIVKKISVFSSQNTRLLGLEQIDRLTSE